MKNVIIFCLVILCMTLKTTAQTAIGISVRPSLPVSKVALPGFSNLDSDGNEEVVLATLGAGVAGILSLDT